MSGVRFSLKVTARCLVDSEVMKTILEFVYQDELCLIQGVSRKFYYDHVPFALNHVSASRAKGKFPTCRYLLKNQFKTGTELNLLYTGSEQGFAATKFHQLCDNKGPLICICQSENDHIFGMYSPESWKSTNQAPVFDKPSFLFKIDDKNKLILFHSDKTYCNFHVSYLMINSNGFNLYGSSYIN